MKKGDIIEGDGYLILVEKMNPKPEKCKGKVLCNLKGKRETVINEPLECISEYGKKRIFVKHLNLLRKD
jgi:hypothetical protein